MFHAFFFSVACAIAIVLITFSPRSLLAYFPYPPSLFLFVPLSHPLPFFSLPSSLFLFPNFALPSSTPPFFFWQALVDGPTTGVVRSPLNFKHMNLTDFKIEIPLFASTSTVRKVMKEADIVNKWAQTAWAKKLARKQTRANLTDFERFNVKRLRIKVCVFLSHSS